MDLRCWLRQWVACNRYPAERLRVHAILAAAVLCTLLVGLSHRVRAAPTEYVVTYLAAPEDPTEETEEIPGPSGLGRFTWDSRARTIGELTWSFDNGRAGALETHDLDAFTAGVLLGEWELLGCGGCTGGAVALHPPQISGFFDFAQWSASGFSGLDFAYTFGTGLDLSYRGSFVTQRRDPNTSAVFLDRFVDLEPARLWAIASGEWVRRGGVYSSIRQAPTAVTTVQSYDPVNPTDAPGAILDEQQPYAISARLFSARTAAASRSGLVYGYQNLSNYNEVVLSPDGKVELREIRDGRVSLIAADAYEEAARGVWHDLELLRSDGLTTVRVNGAEVFSEVRQPVRSGRAALVTHATTASFDDVRILRPTYRFAFKHEFDNGIPDAWQPVSGHWTATGGSYRSDAAPTAVSLVRPNAQPGTLDQFGFRARVLNPGSGSANTAGLVWNGGRNEVVFTPSGEARLNTVTASGTTTVAQVPIRRLGRKWFQVELDVCNRCGGVTADAWSVTVKLDGAVLFQNLQGEEYLPEGRPVGEVGLVAHATAARFDDVELRLAPFPERYFQRFDARVPEAMVRSGSWSTTDGIYRSRARGRSDIAVFPAGGSGDFVYRARVQNAKGRPVKLAGLVTNYNEDGDHYETVFSSTGHVLIAKVIKGRLSLQAIGRHSVPPGEWFDAEIRGVGPYIDVNVNGKTVLSQVPQGQLRGGRPGFITHWSGAKFDEVSWEELRSTDPEPCRFCDDFNDGNAHGWRPNGGSWAVEDGKYVARGGDQVCQDGFFSSNTSLIRQLRARDVDISADIRSIGQLERGFIVRSSGPGNHVEINLRGDPQNSVEIQELRDCESVFRQVLFFPTRYSADVTNRFRAWLIGNHIRVWMNDRLVAEFDLPILATDGAVGLGVGNGGRAIFDDVRVNVLR